MDDPAQRLGPVLATQVFPAERWELITTADHYGADVRTRADLQAIPAGHYRSLTHVVSAIRRHHPNHLRSHA